MNRTQGKVYVLEKTIGKDGKETKTKRALDNVYFCNIDHKWYSPDGTLSPLYEQYKGKVFYVQFKWTLPDKTGKEIEYEGKWKMIYKIGELPWQDFENVPAQHEKKKKWMEKVGMLTGDEENDDGYRIMREVQGASMTASLAPGCKIEDSWALHIHTDALYIIDDFVDKKENCKGISFKDSDFYWSAMSALLEGKRSEKDTEELLKPMNLPAPYFRFIKQVEELRRHTAKDPIIAQPLIDSFVKWYEGGGIENCLEWKKKEAAMSIMYKATEPELRILRCGGEWNIELILFDMGVHISQKVRNSFLYKSLVRAWCQHCSLQNDIVSLKKELREGVTCNKAYLYHVHHGMELKDALDKACEEVGMWSDVVLETGELLVDLYGKEFPQTRLLVNIVYGTTYGNLQWSGIGTRYHKDMVFECVVDVDEE